MTFRRVQYMNFLHRGALTFDTLVYDTNVGDIRFHKNFMRGFVKTIYRFIAFTKLVFGCKLNNFHTSFGFNRHLFKTFHNYGQFVSPLDSYFNRERVSLGEIHEKYGHNGQVSFSYFMRPCTSTTGELSPNVQI